MSEWILMTKQRFRQNQGVGLYNSVGSSGDIDS